MKFDTKQSMEIPAIKQHKTSEFCKRKFKTTFTEKI